MTTTIFDPSSLLRTALITWWDANSATLSALGTPILADDDGSPASTATGTLPTTVVRLGDAVNNVITNHSRIATVAVVFYVHDNTRHEATEAAKPLDKLLAGLAHSKANLFSLAEGNIVGVKLNKFRTRQLSKTRWRAERECEFEIRIDRKPA